jgi:hypothetical protein
MPCAVTSMTSSHGCSEGCSLWRSGAVQLGNAVASTGIDATGDDSVVPALGVMRLCAAVRLCWYGGAAVLR